MKSYSIELGMLPRSQYVNTQMYFRNCAVQWFENNSVSKCMRKSNSGVVCSGTRNSSHRRFDNGFPLILPFNIDLLTANKTLNTVSDLPVSLTFQTSCGSKKYELLAVTYGSGGHFIAAIKMYKPIVKYDGWYLYDGIVEKRKQGTGLQLTVGVPTPPKAYRMSYAIYLKRD